MKNNREYRNFTDIQVRTDENENMVVEGYATVFDTPYTLYDDGDYIVREQIARNAFEFTDMSDVIMQYDHKGRVFARNKNGTLQIVPDERGLKTIADLSGTDIGRQLYQEIDGGYTDKMSFGFTISSESREVISAEGEPVTVLRTITGIKKLYDVSAVSIPANDATEISARSYCDGVIAEVKAERQRAEHIKLMRKKLKVMMLGD